MGRVSQIFLLQTVLLSSFLNKTSKSDALSELLRNLVNSSFNFKNNLTITILLIKETYTIRDSFYETRRNTMDPVKYWRLVGLSSWCSSVVPMFFAKLSSPEVVASFWPALLIHNKPSSNCFKRLKGKNIRRLVLQCLSGNQ